ncbi:MAG: 2-hydroxyacid dehydrogenase [Candidatus Aenigmatarchaeota archaeon]
MKYNKILIVGINESKLDKEYWETIGSLTKKLVTLPKDSPEINTEITDADCLLVNFGVSVDRKTIDKALNLKYIGVLATAYGKVDTTYAKSKNIAVCNIAGYSTESVAEFVLSVILEHIRQLEEGKQRGRNKNYSEAGISATEIKNKIFGIVGLGSIGSRVAEIALGFGADVRYWSRNRKEKIENMGVKYTDVSSLVSNADFLSLHLAQTNDTEGFLNIEKINKIKKGAIVINTAPMELVDIDALSERLAKGDITFILDHSDEMAEDDLKKISKYANCIIYPPIGYITKEARMAKQEIFVGNIENFLKGSATNKVN